MDEKFGLQNIANRKIKASTFMKLNDPFELLCIKSSSRKMLTGLKETKRKVSEKFGILCFSEIWSNPVQWAHYANNHQGLCIELELGDGDAQKVEYKAEMLDCALMSENEIFIRILLTKFKHWEYEKEFRVIRVLEKFEEENGLYFQPFNNDIRLTKIIIGCQSNITRKSIIEKLHDADKDVEIIYSKASSESFEIIECQNK